MKKQSNILTLDRESWYSGKRHKVKYESIFGAIYVKSSESNVYWVHPLKC